MKTLCNVWNLSNLFSYWHFKQNFFLTYLARLVVCVSPNYLWLVDREHQTCGGAYLPQPTRYCYCTNKDKHKTKDKYLYDVGPMEYVNLDIVTAKQINA